jgi:hypothetical protein
VGKAVVSDRRTLRDITSAYQAMKEYQRDIGQQVQWFRFDQADTTSDPVYETGPQRIWYPAITMPCYLAEYQRSGQNFDDDGLYIVDRLHLILSYNFFFNSAMPDPDPTGADHVNDRVGFQGVLFSIDTFYPQGRVADYFLTISCDCRAVAQSEMIEDVTPPMFASYIQPP